MNRSATRRVAAVGVAVATVILVLGIGVAALFNPPFVAFEQGRAGSTAWTGYTTDELRTATDAILGQLYFGGRLRGHGPRASRSSTRASAPTCATCAGVFAGLLRRRCSSRRSCS